MINHIFRDLIDLGLLAYIDDFLIYAKREMNTIKPSRKSCKGCGQIGRPYQQKSAHGDDRRWNSWERRDQNV